MKKTTKIHLYIRGNCGNQFFQYAFARNIQEKTGGELIINYCKNVGGRNILSESENLLQEFNTKPYLYENCLDFGGWIFKILKGFRVIFGLKDFEKKTYKHYCKLARVLPFFGVYYFDFSFYPFVIYKRRNIFIYGYYESPKYFGEIDYKIKKELRPKRTLLKNNEELYNTIINSESVCVTLKRQDTDNPKYAYNINYYYTAMDYISEKICNPVFIIFSDDIEWCKKNIHSNKKVLFETDNNPIWEKIRLMSACKHFIIYNSTFSWWAQHLSDNEEKIVVAPSKWMKRDDQPIDIYEDGWIYLDDRHDVESEY